MSGFESLVSLPSPCQLLDVPNLFGRPVWVKRDDLLHAQLSGNKFRKLKYPLRAIAERAQSTGRVPSLITMGGLWSNHVHATAYAAANLGYPSLALIRGHDGMQSAMLDDCIRQGMQIRFVDRTIYRQLRSDPALWQSFAPTASDWHWLPEGGSDPAALHGVAELIDELPLIPDMLLVACGTGATLAGLLAGLKGRGTVIAVAVIADGDYLRAEVSQLLQCGGYPDYQNYRLLTDAHHGGYARASPELLQFCRNMPEHTNIAIEPVYTGKVFFALQEMIHSGMITLDQSVMVLHTGGLQGQRGWTITP